MQENRKCRTKGASWRTGRLVPRRSSLDSRSSRLLSAGLTGLKGAMEAKQRLDYRTLVPWTDERSYLNESARGHIGRSPFATPTGQRSVSELAPDARLPRAQAVASSATGDGMRSWLTAQVQILSSLGSSMTKNHDKEKDPLYPSHPASTPASHRSARRPQRVGASEGIWSQVPLVHIYASG